MGTASDQSRREAGLGRRQLLGAAAALVAAPTLVAVAYGAPSRQDSTPDASPEATPAGTPSAEMVTIEALDFGFDPSQVTVAIGDTIELFSSGQAPHNFIIEGYEDEIVDFPEDGSTVEWTVPDTIEPGTYVFYCGIGSHRAQGMEGEITITEAAAAESQTVEAFEFGFEPAELTVATGATLGFFSSGEFPHNFIIEGYEDEIVDYPQDGSTVEWTVPDSIPAGTYTFYCGIGNHRAQGMEGEITITAPEGSGDDAPDEDAPIGTTLEAFDFGYTPLNLRVSPGQTVEIFSSGQAPHDFTIEGYVDEKVAIPQDGESVIWTVPDTIEPGTYTFYCSVGSHRAQGMEGKIEVTG